MHREIPLVCKVFTGIHTHVHTLREPLCIYRGNKSEIKKSKQTSDPLGRENIVLGISPINSVFPVAVSPCIHYSRFSLAEKGKKKKMSFLCSWTAWNRARRLNRLLTAYSKISALFLLDWRTALSLMRVSIERSVWVKPINFRATPINLHRLSGTQHPI